MRFYPTTFVVLATSFGGGFISSTGGGLAVSAASIRNNVGLRGVVDVIAVAQLSEEPVSVDELESSTDISGLEVPAEAETLFVSKIDHVQDNIKEAPDINAVVWSGVSLVQQARAKQEVLGGVESPHNPDSGKTTGHGGDDGPEMGDDDDDLAEAKEEAARLKVAIDKIDEKETKKMMAANTRKTINNIDEVMDTSGKAAAFSAGLDQVKQSIKLVQKCLDSGCDANEISGEISSIISTIGGVIACFNPAAGAIISAVGALGSFVSSFFGSPQVARAMPGLDADAVESAAFRAVMAVEDTKIRAEFADFKTMLKTATVFNSQLLEIIKNTADVTVVDQLIAEWFEQYHEFKWSDVVSRMKDTGKAFSLAYADIEGSRRGKFSAWAKSSPGTCSLEHYLKRNNDGRNTLIKCKENMKAAKTNYDYLKAFGGEYSSVSNSVIMYWTGVVAILQSHSTCHGKNAGNLSCHYFIRLRALNYEVTEGMTVVATKVRETTKKLATTCEAPAPNVAVWPWNQVCPDFPGKCTYQYLVFTTESDQAATVGGCEGGVCKMLIKELSNNEVKYPWSHPGEHAVTRGTNFCKKVVDSSCDPSYLGHTMEKKQKGKNYILHFDAQGAKEKSYFKQDNVIIGYLTESEANIATFKGGDQCDAISAKRSGTVEFVDDCGAKKLTVVSVDEPSTCVYKMVISGVCPCRNLPETTTPVLSSPATKAGQGFYGGIIGYKDGQHEKPEHQSCGDAIKHAHSFNHDFSMFAIPAYTLEIPECVTLLDNSENFGIPSVPTSSEVEPKRMWRTRDGVENECHVEEPSKEETLAWCHYCPSSIVVPDTWESFSSWKQACCSSTALDASKSLGLPTPSTDKWCATCPTQWSVMGKNGWDDVCWEEKMLTCNKNTAITTIYGHAAKAATMLNWSSGFKKSSGGYWTDSVEKESCSGRGVEEEKCFWEDYVNDGCMYD